MLSYIARRLLGMIPTLLIVVVIVFLFVHILPGDPARLVAGSDADEATINLIRKDLGLDLPLPQQFLRYVEDLSDLFAQHGVAAPFEL